MGIAPNLDDETGDGCTVLYDMGTEIARLARVYIYGRRERREITRQTAIRNRTTLTAFCASYGRRPVANMSRTDVERWQAQRGHLAAGTRRYEYATARGFVHWLMLTGKLKRDPFAAIKPPRVPRSVPRAMPRADADALVSALPDARARAVVALMLGLGLRVGEVATVETGDYDAAAGTLLVRGKGGHERLLPVTPGVRADLDAYLRTTGAPAGPLIRKVKGSGGLSTRQLGKIVRWAMESAGVKDRPGDGRACHSLRHTRASEVAELPGVNITVLQAILGHQSLASTQIYLRRAELGRMREALELSSH